MESIGIKIKVFLIGRIGEKKGVREFDAILQENASLQDLVVLLSERLGASFAKELKPIEGIGAPLYVLMINGISADLDALSSIKLKDQDVVTVAPILIGGG
ncbi:MAG: hypothetical protein QW220_00270 [Candidatus Bathyarchaeia archaeon]